MRVRRIITVASGKGGVGKTTFAINFSLALSRVAPTVLVDLDAATSSVRNTIDAKVERDLYHFFRRGEPLERCLSGLPHALDPDRLFAQFSFVAAPLHAMEPFTNQSEEARWRLMRAINDLPTTFVVLDLPAGVDARVLDFLPHSNSGILVFTPHHPAATAAAAGIVKALMFRKLRLLFATNGPLAGTPGAGRRLPTINQLLDEVEDSYDGRIANLDVFLRDLFDGLGDVPVVRALAENIASFSVFFVLNLFDGVHESFDRAIAPFVRSLHGQVSSRIGIHNLGWIVAAPEVHEANCLRRPVVLDRSRPEPTADDPLQAQLDELAGLPRRREPPGTLRDYLLSIDAATALTDQLDILNAMHRDRRSMLVRDNFAYIVRRVVHVIESLPPDRFGHRRLLNPGELLRSLLGSAGSVTPGPDADASGAPLP
jgi:MinD-like ATPase involved in chromosome partitioning or flagellar assembly